VLQRCLHLRDRGFDDGEGGRRGARFAWGLDAERAEERQAYRKDQRTAHRAILISSEGFAPGTPPHDSLARPLRRLAPFAWLARNARSRVASTNVNAGRSVCEIGSDVLRFP